MNPTPQSPLTPEDLDAIEARANAATEGPWTTEFPQGMDTQWLDIVAGPNGDEILHVETEPLPHVTHPNSRAGLLSRVNQSKANLIFCSAARADIPRLTQALREAWAREATQEANCEAIGQDYVRVNSELQARIAELEAQGKSDTEMLDWLDVEKGRCGWLWNSSIGWYEILDATAKDRYRKTLREAITAAMKESKVREDRG